MCFKIPVAMFISIWALQLYTIKRTTSRSGFTWTWLMPYQFLSLVSIKCFSACNRSELFARASVIAFCRFPSLGLLRSLLYLEVRKPRSASGIELETPTFRKSLQYFLFLALLIFSGGQKIFFVSFVIGSHRAQSQRIGAQASHPLAKVQNVRLCCEYAGFCCEGCDWLWALVPIHREPLYILLTHVWKSALIYNLRQQYTYFLTSNI